MHGRNQEMCKYQLAYAYQFQLENYTNTYDFITIIVLYMLIEPILFAGCVIAQHQSSLN